MSRRNSIRYEFVEYIPQALEEGTLYVSMPFATAVHLCCCGCGQEVVTPITPTDWSLTFDGEAVSLAPSIGNWGFACESHYWIRRNQVCWAGRWTGRQIAGGRARDRARKRAWFDGRMDRRDDARQGDRLSRVRPPLWGRIRQWLTGRQSDSDS